MKYFKFSLLFFILLSFSCETSEEAKYSGNLPLSIDDLSMSDVTELTGINTEIMSDEAVYVYDLLIVDSLLIVNNSTPSPYFYSIYNLKDEKKIRSFGRQGRGPGELSDFNIPKVINKKKGMLGMMVPNEGGTIYTASLDSLLNDSSYQLKKAGSIGFQYNNNFISLNDRNLFTISLRTEHRLTQLNLNGEVIGNTLSYPFESELKQFPKDLLGMIFQALIVKNEKLQRGAIFTMMSPNIDIFEFKNDSVKSIKQIHLGYPSVFDESNLETPGMTNRSVSYASNNKTSFISITSTENYIYALYSGRTPAKYPDDHFSGEIVFVLDWDGNLVNKLKLDKEAYAIVVTDDDETIYAVQESSDSNSIRKYPLSK